MQKINNKHLLSEILNICLEKNFSFYAFKNPSEENVNIGIQTDGKIMSFDFISDLENKNGFVICPFDKKSKYKSLFINKDLYFSTEYINIDALNNLRNLPKQNLDVYKPEHSKEISTKDIYYEQIETIKSKINKGIIKKAILSRILSIKSKYSPIESFINLLCKYTRAYVFYVHIPSHVSWMGATPEKLVSYDNKCLRTMALAATQKLLDRNVRDVVWNDKEKTEQALVCEYIDDIFNKMNILRYNKQGPVTSIAGSLVHLKTQYSICGKFNIKDISNIIDNLHPTPAICGLPKTEAMDIIRKTENHDREYYAGYLGCVNDDSSCDLFVNLRSMKINSDCFDIYVGGGITKESVADSEWTETCYKSEILLSSL